MEKEKSYERWIRLGLPAAGGVIIGYIFYFLILSPHPGFPKSMDFLSWYAVGRMVLNQDLNSVYDLEQQIAYQRALSFPYETPGGALIFNRPPHFIYPFIPLALLSYNAAYILWLGFIVTVGIGSLYLLAREVYPADDSSTQIQVYYLIFGLAFYPVFQSILLGQTSLIELNLLIGVYLTQRKRMDTLAGVFAGLAAFKPQFILFFLPPFLIRRSWKTLAVFISVIGIQILAGTALVGVDGVLDYLEITRQVYSMNCIYGVYPELHQTWRGLLVGFMLPLCESTPSGMNTLPALQQAGFISNILNFLTTGLVLIAFWIWRKVDVNSSQFDLLYVLLIFCSLLASPYSNPQDLSRLIFALALLLRIDRSNRGLLPTRFSIPVLVVVFLTLGPLTMTAAVQKYHPMVITMILLFGILFHAFLRTEVLHKYCHEVSQYNSGFNPPE